jgi:hypothetical protein
MLFDELFGYGQANIQAEDYAQAQQALMQQDVWQSQQLANYVQKRGREEETHLAHNQEIVGSNPTPATRMPRFRLTDPEFHYSPSYATDIRRTFARVRARMRNWE